MGQKIKFIILGLAGLLLIFIFLYIQSISSRQPILRERDDLKKENISLNSKLNKLQSDIRDYENKSGLLKKDLEKLSREKQEAERKYESANKDKEEVLEKLKSKEAEVQVAPQPQVLPQDTDAYWAGILKAKTDLGLQLGSLRNELKSTQITNEQLQREKSIFDLDIKNLKGENEDLKRQLEYNQKVMDSVTQDLVREKNDKIKIQDIFKSIRNENAILTRQLKSLIERKASLEKRLQELQEKNVALERRFTEMQTMLTAKISQINGLQDRVETISGGAKTEVPQEKKETVELPPIIVRPQPEESSTQAAVATPAGKILAINRDTNFVIIDLGEDTGINIGNSFQVYRNDKPIATIEVIQLRKDVAACDIKKETTPIRIGDIVK
jgi:predicted nuclease with TOPRIM domain